MKTPYANYRCSGCKCPDLIVESVSLEGKDVIFNLKCSDPNCKKLMRTAIDLSKFLGVDGTKPKN